jgi:hypothetical protein
VTPSRRLTSGKPPVESMLFTGVFFLPFPGRKNHFQKPFPGPKTISGDFLRTPKKSHSGY